MRRNTLTQAIIDALPTYTGEPVIHLYEHIKAYYMPYTNHTIH